MASPLRTAVGVLAAACVLAPAPARAAAYYVSARTEAQAYQMRAYRGADPTDPVLLPRRRIVQYLGLDVWEIVTGEDLGFESNLRLYTDFGLPRGEAAQIQGLRSEDADLMYAYARWRRGGFEGKVGRQYFIDSSDIIAFDGVRARYVHSLGVGAEAYAGLWVKSGSLLGSPQYQLDGVMETEGPVTGEYGVDPFLNEQRGMEPLFGVRLVGENVMASGVSGALGYRRSMIAGKVTSEILGTEVRYSNMRGINASLLADYDLIMSRLASFRLLGRYDADTYAAQLELMRFNPTFSSYSIWYYFATAARDEVRLRGDYLAIGPMRYYAQVLAANYNTAIKETSGLAGFVDQAPTSVVLGAGGGAQFLTTEFRSGVDVTWRNGWGGRQLWVDVTAGYNPSGSRWTIDGRFSFASIRDSQQALLRGNFYGAQLWGSYLVTPAARASLVIEQNVNPFTRSDTKAFFVFDLKAVL